MTFDISTATIQEAVDYSVQQIVKQGGRCISEGDYGTWCEYGDGKGRHCAVGWLLDHDNEGLMGAVGGVTELIRENCSELPPLVTANAHVLELLQRFHDKDIEECRRTTLKAIASLGIDTSGEWFQQWIKMGVE